jgi:hypothetical protein
VSSLIDSKHQKLSQDEIIAIAAKEAGQGETFEQVKASLMAEAHQAKALIIHEGNTLYVVHRAPDNPSIALFRALNADTIPNFCKSTVKFAKAIGLAGIEQALTQFPGDSYLGVVKYVVKKHPPFKNMSYEVQKSPNGDSSVLINMGNTQKGGLPDKEMPATEGSL